VTARSINLKLKQHRDYLSTSHTLSHAVLPSQPERPHLSESLDRNPLKRIGCNHDGWVANILHEA